METARVQKWIAQSGLCSRRKAEDLISSGKVKVNGGIAKLGDTCKSSDEIIVNGKKITIDNNFRYIILNKPKGYVCSKSDPHNKKTIYGILEKKDKLDNLFSIGRLDKYTTGLIILTNDGEFNQKVIHPSSKIVKEYETVLNKKLETKDKISIEKGLTIDGYKLSPCKIQMISPDKCIVMISEGRNRQIRKIFEKKGYQVRDLKRIKIGKLQLGNLNLKVGEYKIVTKKDLDLIFN